MSEGIESFFTLTSNFRKICNDHPDFTIVHCGKSYRTNDYIAAQFSETIELLLMSDPIANSMNVKLQDGPFNIVMESLCGNIGDDILENVVFCTYASIELRIGDLYEKCIEILDDNQLEKNIKDFILQAYINGCDIDAFVDFLASKFELLEKLKMDLPFPLIEMILKSPAFIVDDESVLSLLNSLFDYQKRPSCRLTKYIPFGIIPEEESNAFFDNPSININEFRWILALPTILNNGKDFDNYKEVFPQSENDFSGIIRNYKVPVVTASSIAKPTHIQNSYGPENLISTKKSENYFCSENGPEEYLLFSFEPIHIKVYAYALKSWKFAVNGVCPSKWILEGSNDKNIWSVLHEYSGDDLAQNSTTKIFKVDNPSPPLMYFRFSQRDTLNPGNKRLALAAFDIFGLVEVE